MDLSIFENELFLLLFLAAAIHSFFLGILLFFKSRKEAGLAWLGFLMLPLSLWLLVYLFYLTELMLTLPHLLGVFTPALYLIGPAFYFFIRQSSNPSQAYKPLDYLHFLPAILVLVEWWPVYQWTEAVKLSKIEEIYTPHNPSIMQMLWASRLIFYILAYVGYAYFRLRQQSKQPSPDQARISWLKKFCIAFGGLILAKLMFQCLFLAFTWPGTHLELISVLLIAGFIHLLGYIVLGKDKILPELIRPAANGKYSTSPLKESQIAKHQTDIVNYLTREQPWLAPSFSIRDLALALDIPHHHVSQVLSEGMNMSFYDLICHYRLEEVKRKLLSEDAQKFSILGIAKDCGFGSKSSFNRCFKKVTGTTPSLWLKEEKAHKISEG